MNASHPSSALRLLRIGLALFLGLVALHRATAQGTAFGYQGQLTDGPAAANGTYDLRFTLWDAATSGQQQGPTVDVPALLLTNGLFQATLDFGPRFDGTARWLEIAIRTNGAAAFETLPTRQPVTPTPYAIHAATASTALSAQTATTATTAGALSGTVAASQVTGVLAAAQVPDLDASRITGGVFTGNGAGLTNTVARELVGSGLLWDGWGSPQGGMSSLLKRLNGETNVVAVSVGSSVVAGLRSDGSVFMNDLLNGSPIVPPVGLSNVVQIACSGRYCVALRRDGTLAGWGQSRWPLSNTDRLTNFVMISVSPTFEPTRCGITADGTLVNFGLGPVPSPIPTNLVAVSVGSFHSLALRNDGTVLAWGGNSWGQTSIPPALSDVVAIKAGAGFSLALKSDGTVVAWGLNDRGQCDVPSDLAGVASIGGDNLPFALKKDGTVVVWGTPPSGLESLLPPSKLPPAISIGGGASCILIRSQDRVQVEDVVRRSGDNTLSGVLNAAGFEGNGGGLTGLNASNLGLGTVPVDRLPDIDASKIATGTLSDNLLSGNIARLNADLVLSFDLRLSDNDLYFRSGTDVNHGLGWFGGAGRTFAGTEVDGPVLYGFNGGALGTTSGGQRVAFRWDRSGNGIFGGDVAVTNTLSVTAPASEPAVRFVGSRTGTQENAVAWLENTSTNSNSSPALRIQGRGDSVDGALSVSADTGRIARFGNRANWVVEIDNAGNVGATSFSGNGAGLSSLDASKIGTGTLSDARLGPNILRLDGNPVLSSDLRLSDNDLYFRSGTDVKHGLGWFGGAERLFAGSEIDGPVLYGASGGALGSTSGGQRIALRWDSGGDSVFGGDVTVTNSLSVTAPSGLPAAMFAGRRTGDNSSPVVLVENTSTTSGSSPVLRVVGRGNASDGALSVSADSGRIARFANTTGWVVEIDNAGNVGATSFSGNGAGLTSLDASKIATGTLSDSLLSTNVPRLDGNPVLSSDLRLSDNDLFFRGGSDTNHGLGWFGGTSRLFANVAVDGPVLYGFSGGALGSTSGGQRIALRWDSGGDSIFGGDVTVTNSLSVSAPSGIRAGSFTGSRTGNFSSAVLQAENTSTNSNSGPALRVVGRGNANDGALSVSADSGRIARFGNSTDWVVVIDNAGNIGATSFVTLSDRDKKAGFADVDVAAVLEKVAALPLQTWHYTNDPAATPHLGPMAQDFHAAFGLGASDRSIATVDADGVALAAIQGLDQRTRELAGALEAERAENRALRRDLESLRATVESLVRQLAAPRP